MTQPAIDAVVLAGGKNSEAMRAATGVDNRALVPLGGDTMLGYIVAALQGAASIGRIIVVGDGLPQADGYVRIAGRETLMDNLLAGLEATDSKAGDRVLVSTSDIPFLTPAAVDDFVGRAVAADADVCYPIIPMETYRQRFPQMKRTTLRLREGTFTGGNLVLISPQAILGSRETILRAYAARKSVLQMGRLLGWGLLARIVAAQTVAPRQLTLAALEAGVARLLGAAGGAAAIVTPYPEIGTDVDKPEDVRLAREILASR